jgi:hypothetical protein
VGCLLAALDYDDALPGPGIEVYFDMIYA